MRGGLSPRLAAGLLTLALWALVAGSALWWWLRAGQLSAPLQALVAGGAVAAPAVDSALVARALGATPAGPAAAAPAPEVASRLALRGVVTHGGRGAALIAVDGKAARPLRVGALLEGVDGGWRLRAVAPHAAVLVADGRELQLEMPTRRSSAGDAVAPPAAPVSAVPPVAPPIPAAPAVLGNGLPTPPPQAFVPQNARD